MIRAFFEFIFGEPDDPSWKPSTVKRDLSVYSHAKAVAGSKRADQEAASRRKLAAKRSKPKQIAGKRASVTEISARRPQ